MNRWIAHRETDSVPYGRTLNVAHRGASAYAPENTIAAFMLAAEMGAQAIELDIQLSYDQQFVVCHDADISRTTNGSGAIHELDLTTLQTFDAGYHFAREGDGRAFRGQGLVIPTLTEVFAAIPRSLLVNVEVKVTLPPPPDSTARHRVVQTLASWLDGHADLGYRERILLSSFDWAMVDAVSEAGLGLPTAYLFTPAVSLSDGLIAACSAGHVAIHPHESLIDERSRSTLAEAHALGIAINVWTVDDDDRMRELLALGVDGIVTNRPDRLAKILSE